MRSAFASALLVVSSAAGCGTLVGDYAPDLELVESAPLCAIDADVFAFAIDVESEDAQPDLESYYERRNPEFVAHLADVHQRFVDGSTDRRVTYLMGAAGVGKSFVLDNSVGAFAEEERCEVELGDWYREKTGSLPFEITSAADLATMDGETVFNELPTLADPGTFDLVGLLEAAGCYVDGALVPLVVIDGVDEIHDDAAEQILEAVDELVLASEANTFVHFLVAGRPEGFWSWLTDPDRTQKNTDIVDRFDLEPPHYATAGDLEFRIRGYFAFTGELDELEQSGEFDDYVASFTDAVTTFPFLTYSIGNLSVGNVVIEQTSPGLNQSEAELKAGLFDDMLQRDAETHGRPGNGESLEGGYRRVLEEIAARYAEDVNAQGVFTTRSEDVVPVTDDDGVELGEVRVRNVLNRAGIAFLVSANTRTNRYRFDPFWLHGHLVERYNVRHYPGYEYRTCQ
jgi:hypothetical protein